jgi:photosystem II stability/assembly factor-like uncharacterized protein
MQMHTNGHGEPGGFADYIQAAIAASDEKDQLSAKKAATWYPAGPDAVPNNLTYYMENGIGRVNCIGFHPTDTNTFYVGVAQGGVWKTTNGGASYTPLTDNLPITRVSDICVDPVNPNTIYISLCDYEYVGKGLFLDGRKRHTHYGLGVYKSTNAGLTWNPTGLTFQLTNGDASLIRKVIVNPSNNSHLLACGVTGMYLSLNGGTNWTRMLDSLFWDMVQDPVNPSTIYASTGWLKNSGMGSAAIYKSTNFGLSWILLNTGIPAQGIAQGVRLAIAPSDPDFVYAMACDDTEGYYGMYVSADAGNTWSYKWPALNILEWGDGTGFGGQGTYDMHLLVNAHDKLTVYTGGVNIWGSTDSAGTFNPASFWQTSQGPTLHGDIHMLAHQPKSGAIFACSDGGLYRTDSIVIGDWVNNWQTNWTNLSNGMQATSFYRLSSSKMTDDRLMAGAQDNASFYRTGNNSWSTIFGGDGMDNFIDPNDPSTVIGSSQYGNFFLSTDHGVSGNYLSTNPMNEASEWVTPIVADLNNPGVLYIGNENIVRSTDGGQTWSPLAPIYSNQMLQQNTEVSALAVSPVNSQVLWAGRRVRHELNRKAIVFKTVNGGVSFVNTTSNLPDSLFYTGIEASPSNSNEAVICMAGFASGQKVFRTTNGGTSWSNISFNLPNIPVNCIKYIPGSPNLMVATDLGVYVMKSSATTWTNYSLGLPNVIVSDIEFNPLADKIYVSTFGRGIWASSLSQLKISDDTWLGEKNMLSFDAFPNPSSGRISVERNATSPARLDVYDVNGRIVHSQLLHQSSTDIQLQVPPGAYYIKVKDESGEGVRKVIVAK